MTNGYYRKREERQMRVYRRSKGLVETPNIQAVPRVSHLWGPLRNLSKRLFQRCLPVEQNHRANTAPQVSVQNQHSSSEQVNGRVNYLNLSGEKNCLDSQLAIVEP